MTHRVRQQIHGVGIQGVGLAVEFDQANVALDPEVTGRPVFLQWLQRAPFLTEATDPGGAPHVTIGAVAAQEL